MKSLFAILFATFAWVMAPAPAAAQSLYGASDPRSVVYTVISLTDRHALPDWSAPTFQSKLRPYLTDDFLRVVAKGAHIAAQKHINLYDADFFTGSQEMQHAKLFSANVIKQRGDAATVEASVGTSGDPKVQPSEGSKVRYELKRVGSVWKIDDFRFSEDSANWLPSIKTIFGDPVKYAE